MGQNFPCVWYSKYVSYIQSYLASKYLLMDKIFDCLKLPSLLSIFLEFYYFCPDFLLSYQKWDAFLVLETRAVGSVCVIMWERYALTPSSLPIYLLLCLSLCSLGCSLLAFNLYQNHLLQVHSHFPVTLWEHFIFSRLRLLSWCWGCTHGCHCHSEPLHSMLGDAREPQHKATGPPQQGEHTLLKLLGERRIGGVYTEKSTVRKRLVPRANGN